MIGEEAKKNILAGITTQPTDVDSIRRMVGLKNWESTKALLLELFIEKRVAGIRASKGWLFWSIQNRSIEIVEGVMRTC